MKKLAIIVLLLKLSISTLKAENLVIPDINFKQALINAGADQNNDNEISQEEALNVTTIKAESQNIVSLEGIEYFLNLTSLDVSLNSIENLNIQNNTLLINLDCSFNNLSSLDVSKQTLLKNLDCASNEIEVLDLTNNTALEKFNCYKNLLTNLDIRKNINLQSLVCADNQLTELDLSQNTELWAIQFYSNNISSIDLSANTKLTQMDCSSNQLSSLDLSNNKELGWLGCVNNQLTSLDLSQNTKLNNLQCPGNQLTTLNISKNPITYLRCENNPFLTEVCLNENQLDATISNPIFWNKDNTTSWVTGCDAVTATLQDQKSNVSIESIYTPLGIKINPDNARNGVYIILYSNGHKEKVYQE